MANITHLILYACIGGFPIFFGGLLAIFFNHHIKEKPIKYEVSHALVTFGAGIILSALVLVFIPRGIKELSLLSFVFSFLTGTILFFFLDNFLAKKSGNIANLLAMLLDFIPESVILGAVIINESKTALFLAIVIGMQNLPEGINAFRDLVLNGYSKNNTLMLFLALSVLGIGAAFLGFFFLNDQPEIAAHLMTFSSGGILYLLVNDIIPEGKIRKNNIVALAAGLGFLVGVVSEKLIN